MTLEIQFDSKSAEDEEALLLHITTTLENDEKVQQKITAIAKQNRKCAGEEDKSQSNVIEIKQTKQADSVALEKHASSGYKC